MVESTGLRCASMGEPRGHGPATVGGGKDGVGVVDEREYAAASVYGSLTQHASGGGQRDGGGDHWTKQVRRTAISCLEQPPRLQSRCGLRGEAFSGASSIQREREREFAKQQTKEGREKRRGRGVDVWCVPGKLYRMLQHPGLTFRRSGRCLRPTRASLHVERPNSSV